MNKDPTRADEGFFRKLKILVVEDSLEMQRLLVALLESMGVVHIAVARDGEKGLAAFAAPTSSSPMAQWCRWTAMK